MDSLSAILLFGLLMALFALVGGVTFFLKKEQLDKILLPLVAFSAGSLLGGALFHMVPEAIEKFRDHHQVFVWVVLGFALFFGFEQFIHWHHCHRSSCEDEQHSHPLTHLILLADGLHNFIGGLGVGSAFIMDFKVGLATWFAALAHEIPQELGDFAILIYGGLSRKKALLLNFVSALAFPLGGLLAYGLSQSIDINFLLPFAAGNFIYIAASDLIPEVKRNDSLKRNIIHFASFSLGVFLLWALNSGLLGHGHHHAH